MLFHSWGSIGRILGIGAAAYIALIILLRISGKRTLTKLNAFDLVVTVALGSTLATILLSRDVALSDGITAFALLILLQFAVTWSAVRFQTVRQLVKSEPTLLCYRGRMLESVLRRERVTEEEVRSVARSQGVMDLESVEAVIMETDGSFSILRGDAAIATTAATDVAGYPPQNA